MTIICDKCKQIHEFKRVELKEQNGVRLAICAYAAGRIDGEDIALLSSYLYGTMNMDGKIIQKVPSFDTNKYPIDINELWDACVKAAEEGKALHLPL